MAKKQFKISLDSKATLFFVLVSVIIYLLQTFAVKADSFANFFIFSGTINDAHFNFSSPAEWAKIILHIFGTQDFASLFINSTFILLLGPVLEERYGSIAVALMIFITALVSGVFATFSNVPVTGSACIVFMLILLNSIFFINKKNLPVTGLLTFILFMGFILKTNFELNGHLFTGKTFSVFIQSNTGTFMELAAGAIGCLPGFLTAPKNSKSSNSGSEKKSKNKKSNDDISSDTTEIGTIEL